MIKLENISNLFKEYIYAKQDYDFERAIIFMQKYL